MLLPYSNFFFLSGNAKCLARRIERSARTGTDGKTAMTPHIVNLAIPRPRQTQCSGARFGIRRARLAGLEELCRLVVTRRARLRRLLQMRAPEIIVRNERRMLQSAVGAMLEAAEALDIGARHDTSFAPARSNLAKPEGRCAMALTSRQELISGDGPTGRGWRMKEEREPSHEAA